MACPGLPGKGSSTALQPNAGTNQPRAVHKATPRPCRKAPRAPTRHKDPGMAGGDGRAPAHLTSLQAGGRGPGPAGSNIPLIPTASQKLISYGCCTCLPYTLVFFPQPPYTKDISIFLLPWSFKEDSSPTFCYVFVMNKRRHKQNLCILHAAENQKPFLICYVTMKDKTSYSFTGYCRDHKFLKCY